MHKKLTEESLTNDGLTELQISEEGNLRTLDGKVLGGLSDFTKYINAEFFPVHEKELDSEAFHYAIVEKAPKNANAYLISEQTAESQDIIGVVLVPVFYYKTENNKIVK